MQRAIVTVKRQNEARVRDLEVPTDVEARRLAGMIARALQWDSDLAGQPVEYEIVAEPPGRVLEPHESLADAGAWDGAWLVFQRPDSAAVSTPDAVPRPGSESERDASDSSLPVSGEGPLKGWRGLGIEPPSKPGPEREKPAAQKTGYVWKQVD